ncbi:uncharacterized protein PV06_00159 [Exophiala oligosperma]|uniref:Spo12 family protein n=2 Tax=Chaetothyriales TaxID=34395 RepID=A0A0D2EHP8_9EURO|nr:uncharacterized protein PV06_00159 [Exophiala oligosperma]KAJ9647446.1 hypothetical protein H2204_000075 [Knufia peltigerae]KIW47464.1 hypothetical protein PV06_00159 [Exophiala oligosperma]
MSPSKTSPSAGALAERSPNTCSPTKSQSSEKTKQSIDEKAMPRFNVSAQQYIAGHGQNQTYISPSDAIASPTTKKLSAIKGKRFANAKPQMLFAKTLAKQSLQTRQAEQDKVQN